MEIYPWQPSMVKRVLRAFARIRAELDRMDYAVRCARLSALYLERELDAAERMLAALQIVRA